MRDWITVKELAQIQGVTPRAVRKSVCNNKYVTRIVESQNGSKYEIFVPSLNSNLQNLIDFEKKKNEIEKNAELRMRKNEIIPSHAKQIGLARFDLVNLWLDYKKVSQNFHYLKTNEEYTENGNSVKPFSTARKLTLKRRQTEAGKEFLQAYNQGKLYPILYKILGNVSIGTMYRWSKALNVSDDYTKLIPNYDYGEKSSDPSLTNEEKLVFMNLLLTPNKINIGKATKLTKFILNKKGMGSPTCERNFRRFADNFKSNNFDKWVLAREGQKALRDKVKPYITRDISKIEV